MLECKEHHGKLPSTTRIFPRIVLFSFGSVNQYYSTFGIFQAVSKLLCAMMKDAILIRYVKDNNLMWMCERKLVLFLSPLIFPLKNRKLWQVIYIKRNVANVEIVPARKKVLADKGEHMLQCSLNISHNNKQQWHASLYCY